MSDATNPWSVACAQFDEVARRLDLAEGVRALLRAPARETAVTLPLRMDDGALRVLPAWRVRYSTARGPALGGLRWHANEQADTVRAQAMWMTWQTALLDLPLGGAYGGVACAARQLSGPERERLARAYVRAFARDLGAARDIVTPDAYTSPETMGWMLDELETLTGAGAAGAFAGRPEALGGRPERGEAAGLGAALCVRKAAEVLGADLAGPCAVLGFGAAGQAAARHHAALVPGSRLVAAADSRGGVFCAAGMDPAELVAHKRRTGRVAGFPGSEPISSQDLLELDVRVLYPAALEGVLTERNADRVKATVVCELAAGATTPEADRILHLAGVHLIPDLLANAGGAVLSYLGHVQGRNHTAWPAARVRDELDRRMTAAHAHVWETHRRQNTPMRLAAHLVAVARVAAAVRARGA